MDDVAISKIILTSWIRNQTLASSWKRFKESSKRTWSGKSKLILSVCDDDNNSEGKREDNLEKPNEFEWNVNELKRPKLLPTVTVTTTIELKRIISSTSNHSLPSLAGSNYLSSWSNTRITSSSQILSNYTYNCGVLATHSFFQLAYLCSINKIRALIAQSNLILT